MNLIEKYFLNSLLSVAPRCTLLPLVVGAYNTVYAVRSLHFALPYFAPLRFAKHRIYWNVMQNRSLCSLTILHNGQRLRLVMLVARKVRDIA